MAARLPLGIQLVGARFHDKALLDAAWVEARSVMFPTNQERDQMIYEREFTIAPGRLPTLSSC
jgi:hypothetical protein